MTWVPLAAAAVLGISGQDDDLSEWAADHRPLFGSDAADASNTLRDLTTAAYAITALAAPKPSVPVQVLSSPRLIAEALPAFVHGLWEACPALIWLR